MTNKIQERFNDLASSAQKVADSSYQGANDSYVNSELLLQWITKAENLIFSVCGSTSTYYSAFVEAKKLRGFETNEGIFRRLRSVFIAVKDEYENGYLTSYKSLIQADLFSSELEQAKALHDAGYSTAAAVIAGTVLETSLRELCERNSLPLGKANKMNDDLARAGIYNIIQQKQILVLANIRNSAAHGKSDEFTQNDVSNMINSIETFLITHLN